MNTYTYILACKLKIEFSLLAEEGFNYSNKTEFTIPFLNGSTYKSLFI